MSQSEPLTNTNPTRWWWWTQPQRLEDTSVLMATRNAEKELGQTGRFDRSDMQKLLNSMLDLNQVTGLEWLQIRDFVHKHHVRIDSTALKMFEAIDQAVVQDGRFGQVHPTAAVLDGAALTEAMARASRIAHPWINALDSIDLGKMRGW